MKTYPRSNTHLALSASVRQDIIKHCLSVCPKEACGILAGDGIFLPGELERTAYHVYHMQNVENSPIGYSFDPVEQLRTEKKMRERQQYMLGIYHSHTATDAEPSSVDISMAVSSDISYMLVSLKDKANPVLRSYRIVDGKVLQEDLLSQA